MPAVRPGGIVNARTYDVLPGRITAWTRHPALGHRVFRNQQAALVDTIVPFATAAEIGKRLDRPGPKPASGTPALATEPQK